MDLQSARRGSALLITVPEARIDAVVAVSFKEAMRRLTVRHPGRILLDLSAVTFLDSSGLGAVVGAMKQIEPGATLELAGLTRAVERVFALTRMDTVFTVHASVAAALGSDEGAA